MPVAAPAVPLAEGLAALVEADVGAVVLLAGEVAVDPPPVLLVPAGVVFDDEPPQAAARAASAARQVIQRVRPITNYAAISRRMSSIASSNSSPWWTPGRVAGGSTAGRRLSSRVATV